MIAKHKYARVLYVLGFVGALAWGITSVRDAYVSGELARDIVPIAVQVVSCLAVAAWTGYEAFKLWIEYVKSKKSASDESEIQ